MTRMPVTDASAGVLRPRDRESARVLPVELFFDLVYVLAITQLTHYLLDHLTLRGAAEALLLFLAVWRGWGHVTWVSNYFDLRSRQFRLVLMFVTFASLIMSASLLQAFDGRGVAFAIGFGAVLTAAVWCAFIAVGRNHPLGVPFERVLVWDLVTALLFLVGGLLGGNAQFVIWLGAIAMAYTVMWLGFPVPRLGHSHTTDYTITGEHIAERCLLFVTIALGESIIITGSNFGDLPSSAERFAALVVAFIGSAAIWWIYFDRGAEAGREVIANAEDPARVGIIGYTYCHILIVFGIIVAAAGDEIAIANPGDEVSTADAALILGGPALYLLGHLLFKLALWSRLSQSRLIGIVLLCALIPVAVVAPALLLITAATLAVLAVVFWDTLALRRIEAESQRIAMEVEA